MICWNASRESIRAVVDAIPILRRADLVQIVMYNVDNEPDVNAELAGSDIALSTTGIAGPNGGSLEKPVGTVCFGFATQTGIFSTDKQLFTGNRAQIREKGVLHSLQCLCNYLETGHF